MTTARLPERRWAPLSEGAAHVGVSTRTLRRYGAQGRLTLYRLANQRVYVDLDELDSLLAPIVTAGATAPTS